MTDNSVLSEKSLLRQRKENGSKRDFGTLLCVCGSSFFRGAASLAVRSALGSGIGLCVLASTEKVIACAASKTDESIYLPLSEDANGAIDKSSVYAILERAEKCSAVLIGPGLSLSQGTEELVFGLIKGSKLPLILDADALNAVSRDPSVLRSAAGRSVVTPHFAEMARLAGVRYGFVAASPEEYAVSFAKEYGSVVVLKSHATYIASPDGKTFVYEKSNSGLSKGGSGDVLSGLIAGLAAQGYDLLSAARFGYYIHSRAAAMAAETKTKYAMLPSDIIDHYPDVYKEITAKT